MARLPKTTPFSFRAGWSAFIEAEISMTLKSPITRPVLNASFLLVVLISLFFNPVSALADGNPIALPNFSDFSQTVQNGEADVLRGVYVPDALALRIDFVNLIAIGVLLILFVLFLPEGIIPEERYVPRKAG